MTGEANVMEEKTTFFEENPDNKNEDNSDEDTSELIPVTEQQPLITQERNEYMEEKTTFFEENPDNKNEDNSDEDTSELIPATEQQPLITQERNEYSEPWSYKKVFIRFNQSAIPFSLMRTTDVIGELIVGYLFSRLGDKYLAANNLIVTSNRIFIIPMTASFFSIAPQYNAHKANDESVGTIIRKGFVCAGCLSAIAIPPLLTSGLLLKAFGIDPDACDIVQDFYISSVLSIPVTIFSSVIRQFALSVGKQKVVLIINALNNILIIGLGVIPMFGLLGFPNLGVKGLGYGYSIAAAITAITYFGYFGFNKEFKKYKFLRASISDLNKFWDLVLEALPFSGQMLSDFLLLYVGSVMIGWLGSNSLSASRIAELAYVIPYLIIAMYSQVTCLMAGSARVANNYELVNKIIVANLFSMFALSSVWAVSVYFSSDQLVELFIDTSNPQNRQTIFSAKNLLWLYPFILIPEIIRYTATGTLRAFKDYRLSMFNSIGVAGVGSGAIYLGYHFGASVYWIYGARNIALIVGAMALGYQCKKKILDYFDSQEPEPPPINSNNSNIPVYNSMKALNRFSFWSNSKAPENVPRIKKDEDKDVPEENDYTEKKGSSRAFSCCTIV